MSIEKLQRLYKKAFSDLRTIKFDASHPWHRGLVLFYLSIMEYTDTFIGLHLIAKSVAMPMVSRTLLEAYIDFKNLHEDPKYGFRLEAAQLKERLDTLRASKEADNPYLDGLEEFYSQEKEWSTELDSLKSKGYKPLNQYEKFKLADKVDEYKSIYSHLCSHSHNNLSALANRYVDFSNADDTISLVIFENYNPDDHLHVIELVYFCLMDSSARLHATLEGVDDV